MPKRNIVPVELPVLQPDCCADCPLLGLVPPEAPRPARSKETLVCLGTMEALTKKGAHVRQSTRTDKKHPWHRPCDHTWHAWIQLPGRRIGINAYHYNTCRIPYEQSEARQLHIKFHTTK